MLNLAIWFAIHTVFRQTVPIQFFPLSFDAPQLASVDPWALTLSVAAAIAIFQFKVRSDSFACRLLRGGRHFLFGGSTLVMCTSGGRFPQESQHAAAHRGNRSRCADWFPAAAARMVMVKMLNGATHNN